MANTLPVSKLIKVGVTITPTAAQGPDLNSLMIVGATSGVIDVTQRFRRYASLNEVAADFGTTAPEYLAASVYFGQSPQPTLLYIGFWAHAATAGRLIGATLSAAQQALSSWTGIANGSFIVSVDGTPHTITGLDFSAATNLNGVASVIQTAVAAAASGATVRWNAGYGRFEFASGTTGSSSAVSFLTSAGSGTDISSLLGARATSSGSYVAPGHAAESALEGVQAIESVYADWYGLIFAAGAGNAYVTDADHLAVAAHVEGNGNRHLYGITTSEAAALLPGDTSSIGAQVKALGYDRTFCQWSSTSPYAACSIFGRGVTVNFNGQNTTITFMWKRQPGVVAESLNSNQAAALDAANYNYYANFNNNTAITVNGKLASGHFIDEIWNADWFGSSIQTAVYNLLYTTPTKIPQTDAGMHMIGTTIEAVCAQAVTNGFLAPGQWNSAGFGQYQQGDWLPKGYYVYVPPITSQSQADRAARRSVPIQVMAKEAGAVHDVAISVTVNQ